MDTLICAIKCTIWKFVAENDTERSQVLWKSILQKEMLHWFFFQCYFSVILSVCFVWHNENDARIGFSHNDSEPNRIIIRLRFQYDYKRFDVVNEWLKIETVFSLDEITLSFLHPEKQSKLFSVQFSVKPFFFLTIFQCYFQGTKTFSVLFSYKFSCAVMVVILSVKSNGLCLMRNVNECTLYNVQLKTVVEEVLKCP